MKHTEERVSTATETERQAAELSALHRQLQASRGAFSLGVAACNSPALRDYLLQRIASSSLHAQVVELPKGVSDVLDFVQPQVSDETRSVHVIGLERSLPSAAPDHRALGALNASRDLWPRAFHCPVIFWMPDYAVGLLSSQAQDFWSWVSHQFDFVSELAGARAGVLDRYAGDFTLAANLDVDRKHLRIAELEQRIQDAGDPPPEELAAHLSVWLSELGFLHSELGRLEEAERMLRKSLEIKERLGLLEGMASAYGNLGRISADRGQVEEARRLWTKARDLYDRMGIRHMKERLEAWLAELPEAATRE